MRLRTTLVVLLAMLVTASTAQAVPRYASPGGSGIACTQAAPCKLPEAVEKAKAGEEVIVGPGAYPLEAELAVPASVYVHGELSQPRPKISATLANAVVRTGFGGAHLEYLEVTNTVGSARGIDCGAGAEVGGVFVSVNGNSAIGVQQEGDCMVRDSVLRASGMGSAAVLGIEIAGVSTGPIRNLTAIAVGPQSIGVRATGGTFMPSSHTIDVKNVVASGEKADLAATDGGAGGTGTIRVSNSNFDSTSGTPSSKVIDESGNQTAAPVFVNAAAGDYREAAGSPTIDAGSTDQIGTLDADGNPRVVGSAPDIGAFEFVPAVVPTPPPTTPGVLQSLALTPKVFKTAKTGGAAVSKVKKAKAPVGTTVNYGLTAATTVSFTVERAAKGRRAGKKCVKQTAQNKGKKACTLYKPNRRAGFSHTGKAVANSFQYSGRFRSNVLTPRTRALGPGSYRLVGSAGGATKSVKFKIVR